MSSEKKMIRAISNIGWIESKRRRRYKERIQRVNKEWKKQEHELNQNELLQKVLEEQSLIWNYVQCNIKRNQKGK